MSFPVYPRYKASGLEWVSKVPEHWEVKRLRRVASINPSKSEVSDLTRSKEVSFLPMEAIGNDGTLTLDRVRSISEMETGYTYFAEGDVFFAKIPLASRMVREPLPADLSKALDLEPPS